VTRRVAPRTLARQDRILAVLHDAEGFPLSTGEIARRLDEREERSFTHRCGTCGQDREHVYVATVNAERIRPTLRRMARDGLVEHVTTELSKRHYWAASRGTEVPS
jgi:hypothetical protein